MSFDKKLRESFDQLADQLRDENKRRFATLTDELGDSYEQERAALVKETEENARRTVDQEVGARIATEIAAVEARMAQAVSAAEARGKEAGKEAGQEAGRAAGVEEGRKLGLEEGQKLGLETGRREGEETGRQQGREDGFREGRKEGLEEGRQAGVADLKTSELAVSERLIEAIRSIDRAKSLTEVLDTLVASAGRHARRAAILLLRNGQLRGWKFIGFGPALDDKNDVDVPSSDAGVIAEAARTGSAVSADSAAANAAPAFAALPSGREVLAVPVTMSGQIVAVLYADPGPADSPGADQPGLVWPSIVELLALHAARCLESITALRAAKALAERPEPSTSTPPRGTMAGDKEDPIEGARRYARLVISEIKLYHESAVMAGRKERDLMTRLGGEISRARVLYEQRVPADVRSRHDYFEDELVKTLAGGDSALVKVRG